VVENGQSTGPFRASDLSGLVSAGRMGGNTFVWTAGMDDWVAAGDVPALAGLFAPPPPAS
jgi:hypothetical protein